jgi:Holliday junction DNA helicase RuvA
MIARIEGTLEGVNTNSGLVRLEGGLTYEVLLSSFTSSRLGGSIGTSIALTTHCYFESQNQGASMLPRLVGFLNTTDRDFFELFTTCKGIGNRKALRAMALATEQIAAAIADRDLTLLQSLPEIGRRMAETIVATLHGKVDRFLTAPAAAQRSGANPEITMVPQRSLFKEGLEILVQLGENRTQAMTWIDQALREDEEKPSNVQDLIGKVYRLKAGV